MRYWLWTLCKRYVLWRLTLAGERHEEDIYDIGAIAEMHRWEDALRRLNRMPQAQEDLRRWLHRQDSALSRQDDAGRAKGL